MSFPKIVNQMGSFGEKRKKMFFRFCRPILDIFGFPLLIPYKIMRFITQRQIHAEIICLHVDLLAIGIIHACEWPDEKSDLPCLSSVINLKEYLMPNYVFIELALHTEGKMIIFTSGRPLNRSYVFEVQGGS